MRSFRIPSKRALIILALSVILLVAALNAILVRATCSYYGWQTDRTTRYAMFVGCMVQVKDQWIPRHELRVVQ